MCSSVCFYLVSGDQRDQSQVDTGRYAFLLNSCVRILCMPNVGLLRKDSPNAMGREEGGRLWPPLFS